LPPDFLETLTLQFGKPVSQTGTPDNGQFWWEGTAWICRWRGTRNSALSISKARSDDLKKERRDRFTVCHLASPALGLWISGIPCDILLAVVAYISNIEAKSLDRRSKR
jgi:hypothetical protein